MIWSFIQQFRAILTTSDYKLCIELSRHVMIGDLGTNEIYTTK